MHLLHQLMVRAAAHQVWRMRAVLPNSSPGAVEVIANQAADEAMTALLAKVHTFEGRSRFTTWAYKFAILQAATDVRRVQWQHREVELHDLDELPTVGHDSPEHHAEASDLARAVARAMRAALTPHQRRVAIALLVDDIPIDVLANGSGPPAAPCTRPSTTSACACAPSSPAAATYPMHPDRRSEDHASSATRQVRHEPNTTARPQAPDAGCHRRAGAGHDPVAVLRRLLRAHGHPRRGPAARPRPPRPRHGQAPAGLCRLSRKRSSRCATLLTHDTR